MISFRVMVFIEYYYFQVYFFECREGKFFLIFSLSLLKSFFMISFDKEKKINIMVLFEFYKIINILSECNCF